jgi:hypothetical protein
MVVSTGDAVHDGPADSAGEPVWRVLRQGDGQDIVLCADFRHPRGERTFADLADAVSGPAGFMVTALPWDELPSADLDAALDALVAEVPGGSQVRAVLGYCAGASLACAVAERLVAAGAPAPHLMLVEPHVVTNTLLHEEFMSAIEGLAEGLSAEELSAARVRVADVPTGHDVAAGAARLAGVFDELARLVFDRLGIDEELAGDLSVRFRRYLNYLLVCERLPIDCSSMESTVVVSRGHRPPEPLAARAFHVDGPRGDLLLAPDVIERVRRMSGV